MASAASFVTGGTLATDYPLYIERSADKQLFDLCNRGEFCYVLTSRQMGKSSLMARTAAALQREGITTVQIDLTVIGAHELTPEQWYYGLLSEVENTCNPKFELFSWWNDRKELPLAQRFSHYFEALLTDSPSSRIVIFVDEIDSTLKLAFTDDFFAAIRAFYNARAVKPEFNRLSFVLIGVATPGELVQDQTRTPFNIGSRVELNDFKREEIRSLVTALRLDAEDTVQAVDRILIWTGGQPYLTQQMCRLLADNGRNPKGLEQLLKTNLLGEKARSEIHFQFVANMLIMAPPDQKEILLDTYSKAWKGRKIACDDQSPVHNRLRLAGILKRQDGELRVRNELYRRVFDWNWIKTNRPTFWTEENRNRLIKGTAVGAIVGLIIVTVLAVFAWQKKLEAEQQTELAQEKGEQLVAALADEANTRKEAVVAQKAAQVGEAEARKQKAIAETLGKQAAEQARLARAAELASSSNLAAQNGDTKTAILLARFGLETAPRSPSAVQAAWLRLDETPTRLVLSGHQNVVLRAQFSPDGSRIVTASADGTARVWDAVKGTLLTELKGHQGAVSIAEFSADGKRIVTAGADGTARVWDAKNGTLITELQAHQGPVSKAMFSPDGRRVVTASADATARVSDAEKGTLVTELEGHKGSVSSAEFSADGKRLVTTSRDGTVRVWDAKKGTLVTELKGSIAEFSADGKRLVTASRDGTVRVWDAETGTLVTQLKGDQGSVSSAEFSADGKRIVTAADRTARVWDVEMGTLLTELKGHQGFIFSAKFSPDGKRVVTASRDGTARVWDAEKGMLVTQLKGHQGSVSSAEFSADGKRVVTASADRTARVWNLERESIVQLQGHEGPVLTAKFTDDGKRVVTTGADGTARVWDAEKGTLVTELKGHQGSFYHANFSADGKDVLIVGTDGTAGVWDAEKGTLVTELKGHQGSFYSADFSADGKRLVIASADRTAGVWDAEKGTLVSELKGREGSVFTAEFSADGKRVATAGATVLVWDTEKGTLITELKGHQGAVFSAKFSPDGKQVVTASADRTARVWDLENGSILSLQGHQGRVSRARFSPDGKLVVTTSDDRTARIWDLKKGLLTELKGPQTPFSAAFSPDGKRIVTGWDRTVRAWDVEKGTLLTELKGHEGSVSSAEFSADGKRVVTASADGTARVWDVSFIYLDAAALIAHVRLMVQQLGIIASSDECKLYFSSSIGARPDECALVNDASASAEKQ